VVFAMDPDAARFILKDSRIRKTDAIFNISEKQKYYFGSMLLALDGDDWRRVRSYVNFGFSNQALSSYFSIFLEETDKSIQTISLDKDLELFEFLSRVTLDVLGITIFNHNFRRIEGRDDAYYTAYKKIFEIAHIPWIRLLFYFSPWLTSRLPIKLVQDHNQSVEILIEFFRKMIKEHKEKKDDSILSKLLQAADKPDLLSEIELLSNIFILFAAGHDTTANALIWEVNCLRAHPDLQEKVYEEIIQVIGPDRKPTEDDLDKLVYLDAFIDEVLRLHPPIPHMRNRIATDNIKYKDMIIPKGARVGIFLQVLHTNPVYWEDPKKIRSKSVLRGES